MARERAVANQLAQLLGASPLPVYALDAQRKIVFCNAACADWLGVSVADLIGQRCDYTTAECGDRIRDLAARLCPPPESFLSQLRCWSIPAWDQTGDTKQRCAECVSLSESAGEAVGVLVIVRDAEDVVAGGSPTSDASQESSALHSRLQRLVSQRRMPYRIERLVGESRAMQLVREQIRVAIDTRVHVQICGPVGSGREHAGRTIHAGSQPEQAGPLMPLACNLLDGELLQATIVAFLNRASTADPAHPATLLLLDADQLNAEAQHELLAFFRLPTFHLRTIATTRRPLLSLAEEGEFLGELACRLSTLVIHLPALHQRPEDLPLLCQRFLEDVNARDDHQLSGFTPGALDLLATLPWNGNVAELQEAVYQSCEQAAGPFVTEADLSRRVRLITSAAKHPPPDAETIKLDEFLLDTERELLRRALQTAQGNKAEAARLLGISRARVVRRSAQLGIE